MRNSRAEKDRIAAALTLAVPISILGRWFCPRHRCRSAQGGPMGKVGRFVSDPKAGAFCQIALDSGEKILVSHDKGGFKGGRLSIATLKWLGLASGETLFELDL